MLQIAVSCRRRLTFKQLAVTSSCFGRFPMPFTTLAFNNDQVSTSLHCNRKKSELQREIFDKLQNSLPFDVDEMQTMTSRRAMFTILSYVNRYETTDVERLNRFLKNGLNSYFSYALTMLQRNTTSTTWSLSDVTMSITIVESLKRLDRSSSGKVAESLDVKILLQFLTYLIRQCGGVNLLKSQNCRAAFSSQVKCLRYFYSSILSSNRINDSESENLKKNLEKLIMSNFCVIADKSNLDDHWATDAIREKSANVLNIARHLFVKCRVDFEKYVDVDRFLPFAFRYMLKVIKVCQEMSHLTNHVKPWDNRYPLSCFADIFDVMTAQRRQGHASYDDKDHKAWADIWFVQWHKHFKQESNLTSTIDNIHFLRVNSLGLYSMLKMALIFKRPKLIEDFWKEYSVKFNVVVINLDVDERDSLKSFLTSNDCCLNKKTTSEILACLQ